MSERLERVIGMGLLIGAALAVAFTVLGWLPPVSNPPGPGVNSAARPAPSRIPHRQASTPPKMPQGPPWPVTYSANTFGALHALARRLGWKPWMPTRAAVQATFEEAYTVSGVLCAVVGPYFFQEATRPIPAREGPTTVTPVALSNGQSATWWWVPGEGGGYYRLNFRAGLRYIRLAGANTVSALNPLATSFVPLSAIRPSG